MPRSSATCAIGRSLSSAKRTPRSSNSSGYFLGLDMTAEDLLSPGQHPRIEVPAKPGPAHFSLRSWAEAFPKVEIALVAARKPHPQSLCHVGTLDQSKPTASARLARQPSHASSASSAG